MSDPDAFSNKDLLLLSQLLHTRGLIQPAEVAVLEDLDDVAQEWFAHKSTQISRRLNEYPLKLAPTGEDIGALYDKMIETNRHCRTTTDLANHYYYSRVRELETQVQQNQDRFKELLQKCS